MEKKKSWAIIISVISLAIAITTAVFLICKNFQFGVEIDEGATFVGICTSLIGIFATVILGLQIWNHLEFSEVRDKIKELDRLEKLIDNSKCELKELEYNMRRYVGNIFASIERTTDDNSYKSFYIAQSILCGNWNGLGKNNNYHETLLARYENLKDILSDDCDMFHVETMLQDFKVFEIPNDYPNRDEIAEIHDSIMAKLYKIKEDNKLTAPQSENKIDNE